MKDRRHSAGVSGVPGTPTVVFHETVDMMGNTHSFEALGRRYFPDHPELPELHPDEFLPGMKRHEDMRNFTLEIAAIVCREIYLTGNPYPVHLNVPVTHLTDDMFWSLQGIRERYGIASAKMGIEVLEWPPFPTWPTKALRIAHEFKRAGYPVYMDDFKGYKTLKEDHLWQWQAAAKFPFDVIKIDSSLLHGLCINLIGTMKKLEAMGFSAFIIEGAENPSDLWAIRQAIAELKATTTVHIQGFAFRKPSHDALGPHIITLH